MIAFLHMVIDIVFFTVMIWLFSKRLDELEDWQEECDERLTRLELKEWPDWLRTKGEKHDSTVQDSDASVVGDGDNP